MIAFLGTGLMGAPIAANLLRAGFPLRVWNRSPAKLEPLVAAGAIKCVAPDEAVAGARIICLCLTDAAAVEEVLFGSEHAAAEALADDAVIMDFSTIGPAATHALAKRTRAAWLDCPVSGGVAGAEAGSLSIFAGGSSATLDRVMSVLTAISSRVTHMGDVGTGQAVKLCNQLIVCINLLAIAEALELGDALGVDASKIPEAMIGGFADSRPLQIFGPRMALADDPGPAVSEIRTMMKDVEAIREEAKAVGKPMLLFDRAAALYRLAIDAGFGTRDLPALREIYRNGLVREENER
jgi:3-hydroxyisobutyrate dehydrogenase/2-hydroxy-3-oxopropionate reductase